jgi:hypothetical protein
MRVLLVQCCARYVGFTTVEHIQQLWKPRVCGDMLFFFAVAVGCVADDVDAMAEMRRSMMAK